MGNGLALAALTLAGIWVAETVVFLWSYRSAGREVLSPGERPPV
jgi:hypothetical protein